MKSSNRIILVLVIVSLAISYTILKVEFKSFDEIDEGLFPNIGYPFLKLCFIGLGVFSLIQFIRKRQLGYLITPSITFITAIIVIVIWQKIDAREASPVKLKAHYDGEIHFMTLTLRANRTYKMKDYGYYGGTTYFGNYQRKGDTIVLNKKYSWGTESVILSNQLLVKGRDLLIKADSTGNFSEKAPFKMRIIKTK